ncbi:hypothetical protein DFR24_0939 [Panacagrimonas perspica]|uniref:Uncharacterized protein n=1 Tax=Panacagrimonas perspica TaxID=381431 RepID=A0A4V3URK9_9GAMM|nr:hypothetical protein [Panacagrimonas perspica]TDU31569.1 hypothetical protein DFR24_0939 [Panacagrimonas perspica]THD03201.1 hypothetical protein B1810_11550 [Panacagrimonas perspica]
MRPESEAPPQADFERIVARRPAGLETPGTRTAVSADAAARISATSFWIAAIALAVIAALVFLVLPKLVSGTTQTPAPAEPAATAPPTEEAAAAPPTPPTAASTSQVFDDAALLDARAAAQTARNQYEEQVAVLQSRGAQTWAASPLAQAQSQAAAGASAFAGRDFPASRTSYQAAASSTAALLAQIPPQLSAALTAGASALEASEKVAAQQAYERARMFEPDNKAAARGLERVASLDAVRAQVDTARRLEQAGDVVGARAAWKQALALDADTQSARDALARLDAQAGDAEFRRALGETLDALDRGNYELAEKRLARARALRANDAGVQQASARLADARRSQKLAALEKEASAQANAEDWTAAIASYRAALQIDSTVAFARDGLVQAEPRAGLSQRLQDIVDRPERLSTASIAADAERSLAQARAIASPGPRLGAQIAAAERAIAGAATPVDVQIQSDGKTEVTLYKVGSLGRFTTHKLQLKPGHYVAIGSRAGYRDVRHEFDVASGAANVSVEVRCEEAL